MSNVTRIPCRCRRYRFHANLEDSRPVKFPPPMPWWETGFNDVYATVVAYLPPDVALTEYWPEAQDIAVTDETEIVFTDRFPKPDWWTPETFEAFVPVKAGDTWGPYVLREDGWWHLTSKTTGQKEKL